MDIKTKFNLGQEVWLIREYHDDCPTCGWNTIRKGFYPGKDTITSIEIEVDYLHEKPAISYTTHDGRRFDEVANWFAFTTKEEAQIACREKANAKEK